WQVAGVIASQRTSLRAERSNPSRGARQWIASASPRNDGEGVTDIGQPLNTFSRCQRRKIGCGACSGRDGARSRRSGFSKPKTCSGTFPSAKRSSWLSAIEMRPRSNIQWTVPLSAMPLRSESGPDAMTVGRLHFASAAAVDDLQAGECASVVVGRLDRAGKGGFPKGARDDALDDRSNVAGGSAKPPKEGSPSGSSLVSPSTVAKPALRMASYSLSGSARTARPKAPLFV